MNLRFQKNWLCFFTVLFTFLFCLPIYFLITDNADWIKSGHFSFVRTPESKEVLVTPEQTVGHFFTATENNLGKIGLIIHRGKNPNDEYIFHLRNSPQDKEDLKNGSFKVKKIQEKAFFEFEPIKDSKLKSFYFYIEPKQGAEAPLGLFLDNSNIMFANGYRAYMNHKMTDESLIFQVYYKNEINNSEFVKILFNRMSQYKPGFLKVPYLYFYWIIFIGTLFGMIYLMLKTFFLNKENTKRNLILLGIFWVIIIGIFLWIQGQAPVFHLG